jgi:hypothetical protein
VTIPVAELVAVLMIVVCAEALSGVADNIATEASNSARDDWRVTMPKGQGATAGGFDARFGKELEEAKTYTPNDDRPS